MEQAVVKTNEVDAMLLPDPEACPCQFTEIPTYLYDVRSVDAHGQQLFSGGILFDENVGLNPALGPVGGRRNTHVSG